MRTVVVSVLALAAARPVRADDEPPVADHFTATVAVAYSYSSLNGLSDNVDDYSESGPTVIGAAGYRVDVHTALGLEVSAGREAGTINDIYIGSHEFVTIPIGISAFVQGTALDRLWGTALVGLQVDRVDDGGTIGWDHGLLVAVEGGADVIQLGSQRLGIYGRLQSTLASDYGYTAAMIGVAYRR